MKIEAIKYNNHYQVPDLDKLKLDKEKVILHLDDEELMLNQGESDHKKPHAEPGSIQEKFNQILGEHAKVRDNVSIGEDKRLLMEAMWEKYGQ